MSGPYTRCGLCHARYQWGAGHDCPRLTYQAQQAAQSANANQAQLAYQRWQDQEKALYQSTVLPKPLLASTPAGRLAQIGELLNPVDCETGEPLPPLISKDDALRLLDAPDLEDIGVKQAAAWRHLQADPEYQKVLADIKLNAGQIIFRETRPSDPGPTISVWASDEDESRASRLADECGALKSENDELLRENAVLRRHVERLERKR